MRIVPSLVSTSLKNQTGSHVKIVPGLVETLLKNEIKGVSIVLCLLSSSLKHEIDVQG